MDEHGPVLVVQQGRQSREHLFKECTAWTREIRELWAAVGEASGGRGETEGHFRSRKGKASESSKRGARPSNTSIRDLLSDHRYTDAVLAFLKASRVGEIKEGVICK